MNSFETQDKSLVAFLFSCSYKPLGIEDEDDQITFIFPADAAVGAEAFYSGATAVAKNLLHAAHQVSAIQTGRHKGAFAS